jgi:hypothetical protein
MEKGRLEQAPTLVKLRQGYSPVTQTSWGVVIRPVVMMLKAGPDLDQSNLRGVGEGEAVDTC